LLLVQPDRLCCEIEARAARGAVDGVAERARAMFGTSAVLGAVALQRAFWDIAEAVANDSSGAGSALELLVARAMAERDRFVAQFSPHPRARQVKKMCARARERVVAGGWRVVGSIHS